MDALAPDLVLRYLRELSADQLGAVVLAAGGELRAGPAELADPARELFAATPEGPSEIALAGQAGHVYAVRDERRAIVVACTAHALDGLVLHDLRVALGDLAGAPPPHPAEPLRGTFGGDGDDAGPLATAAERLLFAAQSRSGA